MKKLCTVLVLVLIVSLMFIACGKQNNIKSELIGTFQYKSSLGTRTITFRGDGTFYESVVSPVLPDLEETGTYEFKKNKIIVNNDDGPSYEWTYNYNRDNGNLVLYFNDWVYTKVN